MNQNFTDIINGLSDGTKDISVNAGTFAGNVSISGNTTIGNASGDDLTVTASLASSIPIKTTNSYDIGSSTLGLRALYFGANSQTVKIQGSSSMSATWTMTLPVSAGTSDYVLKTDGSGVTSWRAWAVPTFQTLTASSGTYTTPANVKWIRVRLVGGGGGGGGSGTASAGAGAAGGNTTFGSSMLSATGGSGGGASGAGGAGGTASLGTGPIGIAISGADGENPTGYIQASTGGFAGPSGGQTPLGRRGRGGAIAGAGTAADTYSGSGGGGGGVANQAGSNCIPGGGGGAGGYCDAIITSPSASYSYTIGSGGTAGTAGTNGFAGGAGGSGIIYVEEYYQ